jgi:hypothetical protein
LKTEKEIPLKKAFKMSQIYKHNRFPTGPVASSRKIETPENGDIDELRRAHCTLITLRLTEVLK